MAHVNSKHGKKFKKIKKIQKIKNTKIKIKWVGGTNLHYLLCLISNTLPQLEQSSLHPQQFSVIATCYRPPATTVSVFSYTSTAPVKKNRSSNRLGTPLAGGLRSQKGLRPFNPLQKQIRSFLSQQNFNLIRTHRVLIFA